MHESHMTLRTKGRIGCRLNGLDLSAILEISEVYPRDPRLKNKHPQALSWHIGNANYTLCFFSQKGVKVLSSLFTYSYGGMPWKI